MPSPAGVSVAATPEAIQQPRLPGCRRAQRGVMTQQNDNPIAIYDIAAKHCQTIQVCIDRLHELGANHQLKLLTGRLQRLAFRATPVEEGHDKDTTTAS